MHYSSGGHPPAVLMNGPDRSSAQVEQLSTPCLVIGALRGIQYKSASRTLDDYAEMFLYSDGVYEVNRPDGTMLERDEFIGKLAECPNDQSPLIFIHRYVCDLQNSEQFEDDYSILQVRFL